MNDSVGRTPDSLCPARQGKFDYGGGRVEKSLAAEHGVQPQGFVFVCNDREGGSLQAALDRSSFRIVRLRGGTFLRMRVPCYRSLCYGISCFCRAEDGLLTMSAAVRGKR